MIKTIKAIFRNPILWTIGGAVSVIQLWRTDDVTWLVFSTACLFIADRYREIAKLEKRNEELWWRLFGKCIDKSNTVEQKVVLETQPDWLAARMTVCKTCGNKRCPHAMSSEFECTGSNEPGQIPQVIIRSEPIDGPRNF